MYGPASRSLLKVTEREERSNFLKKLFYVIVETRKGCRA